MEKTSSSNTSKTTTTGRVSDLKTASDQKPFEPGRPTETDRGFPCLGLTGWWLRCQEPRNGRQREVDKAADPQDPNAAAW